MIVAVGCGSDNASPTTARSAAPAPKLVAVQTFADRIAEPGVVTINVHVPNEGNIAGTDLEIPFDQIGSSTDLPTDLTTPLAVYCRSGNMSATAVKDLRTMGYTDVTELDGGYDAWVASGRTMGAAATG